MLTCSHCCMCCDYFLEKALFCLTCLGPLTPCVFLSPSVVCRIPLNDSSLFDSSIFSCTLMNHGLSITSFKSVAGLNIDFIGFNFDFVGLQEIGVNMSCNDSVSFCFTNMYDSKLFNTE